MEDKKALLEKYLEIVNSKQNQRNKKYWENANEPYLLERWRGRSLRKENTPFTMALDISGYSRVLDINCIDYYNNPEDHLTNQLKYAIWEFENLKCHRYFENAVFIGMGSTFEASFFGANIHYLPGAAPWIDEKNPVLKDKADLLKLKPFDFYKSGHCEKAYRFYEVLKKLTAGYNLRVMFPTTFRSPFSIAIMLRGFNDLLMDIYDDPGFFNDLMQTITGYLKEFFKERADFLSEPMNKCFLFNDEISTPIISDKMYQDLILSYEIELSEYCGGVRYWHSCGVTNEFYGSVNTIPGLRMMHIGPWSDIRKAVDVFSPKDIALEICLNAVGDVYDRTEEEMRKKLQSIKDACDGRIRYSVRADGFGIIDSVDHALNKISSWNKIALEIFPG